MLTKRKCDGRHWSTGELGECVGDYIATDNEKDSKDFFQVLELVEEFLRGTPG